MATTARSARPYLNSSPNTMTSSTSSCRPGDSGHTRLDAEDVATRAAGFILRTGAAGAEQRASGSFRHIIPRLISRLTCRVDDFRTDRGTLSRPTIPTALETWNTRGGGQQRGTGQPHRKARMDMDSGDTKGALAARLEAGTAPDILLTTGIIFNSRGLARGLTATMEGGTASAILPTTGVLLNSSGRPPAGKITIMVFPRLGQ